VPWNPAQTRLFLAAAHNPDIAAKHGMKPGEARDLAMESSPGERSSAMKQSAQARALRKKK